MPMVTVSISPLQAAGIRAVVDDGAYSSSSEVVREALRLWDAARKQGGLRPLREAANGPGEATRNGARCVGDMFADYEAEKHRHA